jgi:hypothetical protein
MRGSVEVSIEEFVHDREPASRVFSAAAILNFDQQSLRQ